MTSIKILVTKGRLKHNFFDEAMKKKLCVRIEGRESGTHGYIHDVTQSYLGIYNTTELATIFKGITSRSRRTACRNDAPIYQGNALFN